MRIAILSDIHANLSALEAVVQDAREHSATHMLCLGDIVGYGPEPVETLRRVRELSNGTVLGNHDAAACGLLNPNLFNPFARETAERAMMALSEEDKAWMRDLPYIIEGKHIACTHGSFVNPEAFSYLETKADAMAALEAMPNHRLLLIGHTHVPQLFIQEAPHAPVRVLPPQDISLRSGCRYIINPGSVGFPRSDRLTADYIIYDTTTHRLLFRSLPYDLAPYRLALVRNGYNPLNYWFLSPSVRRRQTELAFRNPTPVTPFDTTSFRAHRRSTWGAHILSFIIGIFIALILTATVVISTTRVGAPSAHNVPLPPERNLVDNFSAWEYANMAQLSPDNQKLLFQAGAKTLLSKRIELPNPSPEKLRFRFEVQSPQGPRKSPTPLYKTRVEFFCEHGKRRYDDAHAYKRFGAQAYTVNVPKEATALRIEYTFNLDVPFFVTLPQLEVKKD